MDSIPCVRVAWGFFWGKGSKDFWEFKEIKGNWMLVKFNVIVNIAGAVGNGFLEVAPLCPPRRGR